MGMQWAERRSRCPCCAFFARGTHASWPACIPTSGAAVQVCDTHSHVYQSAAPPSNVTKTRMVRTVVLAVSEDSWESVLALERWAAHAAAAREVRKMLAGAMRRWRQPALSQARCSTPARLNAPPLAAFPSSPT